MDHCLELSYDIFIAEEILEQAKMERFINESVLIAEGTNSISNMTVIVEAFADKFKEVIRKIINAIVNVWHKFLEGMNTLVKSDKAYLEKYQDTILKRKVKLGEISMPNYQKGMNDILNKKIPAFNYDGLKINLSNDKNDGSFRRTFYTDYKTDIEFSEFCKNKFKGGENDINIQGNQLNMTNLYNFCHGFDKFARNIQTDINNINKVGNQALAIIDEKVRNMPKSESGLFESAKYFSYVYESFITELKIEEKPGQNQQNQNQQNKSQTQSQVNGEHDDKDTTKKNLSEESPEEATDNIKTYISVCGSFLAAKMTVARNCHKDYMAIIRAHVRSYTGDNEQNKDPENKKQKDNDTNTQVTDDESKEKTKSFSIKKWL